MGEMFTSKSPKIPKKYDCEVCDYHTSNKKDYMKHISTAKHKTLTNAHLKTSDCLCGKTFQHRQSLSRHKKICSYILDEKKEKKNTKTINSNLINSINSNLINSDLINNIENSTKSDLSSSDQRTSEKQFILSENEKTNLINSNLINSNLINSNLINSDLINSNLINSNLINSDLINSDLINSDLINNIENSTKSDLSSSDQRTCERQFILSENEKNNSINSDSINSDLLNSDLINSNLINSDLINSDLINSNLINSNLINSDLINSNKSNNSESSFNNTKSSKKQKIRTHKKTIVDILTKVSEQSGYNCEEVQNFVKHMSNKTKKQARPRKTKKESSSDNVELKEIIQTMVQQNNNLQELLLKQSDTHREEIQSMIPKIGNTTNNKFNLNIYLNEECKDAVNIMDFVQSLQIGISELETTAELGYIDGITDIMVNGLKELETTKRPIHCSDLKREILYIKDNDVWQKETYAKSRLKHAIKHVSMNNAKQINHWIDKNPNCNDVIYNNIIMNSVCENDEQQDKFADRIIKNVAKNVIIDKDNR